MRRQRNILQVKEHDKNPQDQINEEEIGKLPEKEFRVMIVKMIQNLSNRIEKIQETFKKELEGFPVGQCLRICLPMQGTQVRALVWEDPTCRRAAGTVSHNY